ncbi:MAG: TetR/AcrR family transcriptional regulator [Thermodesulfobacteriota bacterium]
MDNKRVPKQVRGIETRNRIIRSGLSLFSEKGLHGTSSREIAAHAGVAIGSFYIYFKDKRALFIEILQKHRINMMEILDNFSIEVSGVNDRSVLMRKLIEAIWQAHNSIRDFDKIADMLRNQDKEINGILEKQETKVLNQVISLLELNSDQLRKKDVALSAMMVTMIIREFMHTAPPSEHREENNRIVNELVDMISLYLFKI